MKNSLETPLNVLMERINLEQMDRINLEIVFWDLTAKNIIVNYVNLISESENHFHRKLNTQRSMEWLALSVIIRIFDISFKLEFYMFIFSDTIGY